MTFEVEGPNSPDFLYSFSLPGHCLDTLQTQQTFVLEKEIKLLFGSFLKVKSLRLLITTRLVHLKWISYPFETLKNETLGQGQHSIFPQSVGGVFKCNESFKWNEYFFKALKVKCVETAQISHLKSRIIFHCMQGHACLVIRGTVGMAPESRHFMLFPIVAEITLGF